MSRGSFLLAGEISKGSAKFGVRTDQIDQRAVVSKWDECRVAGDSRVPRLRSRELELHASAFKQWILSWSLPAPIRPGGGSSLGNESNHGVSSESPFWTRFAVRGIIEDKVERGDWRRVCRVRRA